MKYRDGVQWLLPRIEGKRVLYVGTVDEYPGNAAKHPPVHRILAAHASHLTGLYRFEAQVSELRAEGLDAIVADPEQLALPQRYEVIVLADTIEHIANPGRLLARLEGHLSSGGSILITTPNPTGFMRILEVLGSGRAKVNPAHTSWYSGPVLARLAGQTGFRIAEEEPIDEMHKYRRKGGPVKWLVNRLLVLGNRMVCWGFPQLAETFGFVLVRADEGGFPPEQQRFGTP